MLHSKERSLTNIMDDEKFKAVAQLGDINLLYTQIQEDPHVLENMDLVPFLDTPLHIAASAGHLQFATEIMRLKPSFAWKLNQQGFSPIHLAIQQGQTRLVERFVDINKDLVRVKGREGLTPLHLVSQNGEIDLLAKFLSACPNSIEDVTVRSETALHIAVKNQQYRALQVLVGWLKRIRYGGAMDLEKAILSWKDEEGNTTLHISARLDDSQALGLLIKSKMDLKAKNLENQTAVDVAANAKIKSKLIRAGARAGSKVTDAPNLADKLRSKITFMDEMVIYILRMRGEISEDKRNAYLVVAALIATATFQSALSPPGGVYQAESGNNTNSTATATATEEKAGKSVMSTSNFLILSFLNALSLLVSTVAIYILTPSGRVGSLLFLPMFFFAYCYLYSMLVISPSPVTTNATYSLLVLFFLLYHAVYFTYAAVYKRLERCGQKRETESRNSTVGNKW